MPHTRIWDETLPPNSQAAAQGALRIRDMKVDITERMAIDHYWDVDVNTDGWHKQITLPELAVDPAAVLNQGFIYTKDSAGTTHLYYRDSAGAIYQLSGALSGVTLPWASITGVPAFVNFLDGLVDPNADSFLIWDDVAGDFAFIPVTQNRVYSGLIGSDGSTGNSLPAGMSASRLSLGIYQLTHNLNTTDVGLVATMDGVNTPGRIQVGTFNKAANTIEIHWYNQTDGPAFTDVAFQFHLKVNG